jgi:hypothetical protein
MMDSSIPTNNNQVLSILTVCSLFFFFILFTPSIIKMSFLPSIRFYNLLISSLSVISSIWVYPCYVTLSCQKKKKIIFFDLFSLILLLSLNLRSFLFLVQTAETNLSSLLLLLHGFEPVILVKLEETRVILSILSK